MSFSKIACHRITRLPSRRNFFMKRIIISFSAILLLMALATCTGGKKPGNITVIEADIAGQGGVTAYLYEITVDGRELIDSAGLKGSTRFSFRHKLKETGFFLLEPAGCRPFPLMLEPGERVSISGDCSKAPLNIVVDGSPGSTLLIRYLANTQKNLDLVDSLGEIFNASKALPEFEYIRQELDSMYEVIFEGQKEYTKALVVENLSSLASIFLVNQRFGQTPILPVEMNFPLYALIDSALGLSQPGNTHYLDHHKRLEEFKMAQADKELAKQSLLPGNKAPMFSIFDIGGHPVMIDSYAGKYVLLYFWAAWDAPSRKYNRALVDIYGKYKNRDFEILAISMDDKRALWEGAVGIDKMNMVNISDLKGSLSPLNKLYNLSEGLPKLFLLDAEGIIVANPSIGDNLDSLLAISLKRR